MTLQEKYHKEVMPALKKELGLANVLAVPKVEKIVVNIGLGEALTNKKALEIMSGQLGLITGQKPVVTRAKKAISSFKLRAGMPVGLKVTLRGKRAYDFLQKLISIVLPRVRDFRGISEKSFDGQGNLSLGFSEIIVFQEADYKTLDKVRGAEISIVTTANTNEGGKLLLEKLGMPFKKSL